MSSLFAALFLFVFVIAFGVIMLNVPRLLAWLGYAQRPVKNKAKSETYECGVPEQLTGHTKMPVKFYLTAILFILFDIEIIFMYPWAATFLDFVNEGHGLYMFSVMGFFLFIFVIGLIWEIKSNALEWE